MEYEEYLQLMNFQENQIYFNAQEEQRRKEQEKQEERKNRILVKDIVQRVLEEITFPQIGVLLCEGDENSIDKAVYQAIFPNLMVVPVGSCCTIMKLLYRVRKKLAVYHLYAFGIIDRDALSKREIKKLQEEKNLYTTKLPFIENIICTPEVITYLCKAKGLESEPIISRIQDELVRILWRQLKETLPINIGIPKGERIEFVSIQAATKQKRVEKFVNRESILYAYRDKVIVSIVGAAFGMQNRKLYYEEIKILLQREEYQNRLAKVMAKYVPKLEMYDLENI